MKYVAKNLKGETVCEGDDLHAVQLDAYDRANDALTAQCKMQRQEDDFDGTYDPDDDATVVVFEVATMRPRYVFCIFRNPETLSNEDDGLVQNLNGENSGWAPYDSDITL